ncbi:MAG: type II toxin-antitoxin system RelE/ParE family toxin [Allosphingosinicella sp.]|uniref:type II toxin-antitoxin system RelE/ParE family toxin n=1 Tax=Allosphingosinicella sp. TaxID=2823234 RepID=UPI003957CE30
MKRLEFAPEAEADLIDIATYIAADNPERALSFVDELEASCAGLLDYPDSGRERPDLAPGLRSKPHGRHVIYYTPGVDMVRIERILHGARDVEGEFGKEK